MQPTSDMVRFGHMLLVLAGIFYPLTLLIGWRSPKPENAVIIAAVLPPPFAVGGLYCVVWDRPGIPWPAYLLLWGLLTLPAWWVARRVLRNAPRKEPSETEKAAWEALEFLSLLRGCLTLALGGALTLALLARAFVSW